MHVGEMSRLCQIWRAVGNAVYHSCRNLSYSGSHLFATGFYHGTGESAVGFFSWVDPQT